MITTLLLAAAALLIGSGLTSMTEAALFSVPLSQVQVAIEKKRRGSARLLAMKQNVARPVAALVILNNAINIGGSIFLGQLAGEVFESAWIGAFTGIFTFLVILFAEIIPKTIGEKFAANIALLAVPLLTLATRILLPVILFVESLTRPLSRLRNPNVTAEEEIRALASLSKASGGISRHESELIRRAFRLNDVTAKDIMTHRLKLSFLDPEKRLADVQSEEISHMHSRILVALEGDLDKINGVVHQHDLLLALAQGRTDLSVKDLTEPVPFVYEGTPAHRLLREFQRTRQHLFVVVDEYGGTSGVVSLEDVLEELVGEIEDEMDARERLTSSPRPHAARSAPRSRNRR